MACSCPVIRFNMGDEKARLKYNRLCENTGLENIDGLVALFEILIAGQVPSLKFSSDELDEISLNAQLDPAAKTNPLSFDADDIKGILSQCL